MKEQTDVNGLYSLQAGPATKVKKTLVYGGHEEKFRRVIIDIIPCVVVPSQKGETS